MIRKIKLFGTTSAAGAVTITTDHPVSGLLHAVEWTDGDLADGVDAVLSVTRGEGAADITLLTLTNANDDGIYYPRYQAHSNVGAALATTGGEEVFERAFVSGVLSLAITSGGSAKSGGAFVYVEV